MSTRLRRSKPHHPGTLGRLETLRTERGFSQGALADEAGVSRLTVIRAENAHPVNSVTVGKLAAALKVDLGELYTPNGGAM